MKLRFSIALLLAAIYCQGAIRRVVVIKVDGLPAGLLNELVEERNPRTGRSWLPWIEEVFFRNGARIQNFYTRGISLSAPSWQVLETGQHQVIHGNMEYDRFTLRGYDYLNFFPFYTRFALKRADPPGPAVLDDAGIPLLVDRFPFSERFQGIELFQRGHHWRSLSHSVPNHLLSRTPKELFDEWESGLELSSSLGEQIEREGLEAVAANRVQYVSFFSGDFDHIAHLTNARESQVAVLEKLDALVGRVWSTIQSSPMAADTVLALVSDHGMNSDPKTFSQGYSLVNWFGSLEGGGHHTVTNRFPLSEYKIRAIAPLYVVVITPASFPTYLKGQEDRYPTVVLDLDGNERASILMRENALNELQILYQELQRPELSTELRQRLISQFFAIRDAHRARWSQTITELRDELAPLQRAIDRQSLLIKAAPRKWRFEDRALGLDLEAERRAGIVHDWREEEHTYGEYIRVLSNLLALSPDSLKPSEVPVTELIPKRSLGERNSIYDLRNYTVGLSAGSFRRIDYLSALKAIRVRNNVQPDVSSAPVDFIAVPLPPEPGTTQSIWLYGGEKSQAVVLVKDGQIKYVPVSNVNGKPDGSVEIQPGAMCDGLPLRLWEDPNLHVPDRESWFADWHSERDWFRAIYGTTYSNGLIGITEQFVQSPGLGAFYAGASQEDRRLIERLEQRRRALVVPEMLVFVNDHWNFNVRNFNPGGNHGSFRQISTHSVLMFAGGEIPRGAAIQEPYDGLSFAPTILRLLGHDPGNMPGPVIEQLFTSPESTANSAGN